MALFKQPKHKKIPSESIIVLDNVSKSYATGAPALNGISLTIKQGDFVFIVGDSGSGKSTLIKLLLRELMPTSGEIYVNGQNLADLKRRNVPKYRRNLGVVFQDFRLLKDRNVYENVAFAQRIIQVPTREIRKSTLELAAHTFVLFIFPHPSSMWTFCSRYCLALKSIIFPIQVSI